MLAVGEGHRRVEFELGLLALARRLVRVQRLGEAAQHLGALLLRHLDIHLRQHEREHLFQQLGIAPEDVKGLVEQHPLVRPVDEDGMQCPVEVAPVGDADRLDRGDGVEHLARPDRQPRRPQGAGEMHQIGDQPPVGAGYGRFGHPHPPAAGAAGPSLSRGASEGISACVTAMPLSRTAGEGA